MVRAAAKNHASVAIVTSPARYEAVLAALDGPGRLDDALRAALALEAFAHTAAYDARIAAELPAWPRLRRPHGLACPADDPYPAIADGGPREGRDPALRREPAPARGPLPAAGQRRAADGLFGVERAAAPGQGALVQQRARRGGGRGAGRGRCAARRASSSSTPTRAAPPSGRSLLAAWDAALEADPVSAFGGVVALTRAGRPGGRRGRWPRSSSRSWSRPPSTTEALEVLAAKPNLRVLVDERLASDEPDRGRRPSPTGSIRTAGGAVLVTAPDTVTDVATTWTCATRRAPDRAGAARPRPRLAARPRRDVERDRAGPRAPADRDRQRADVAGRRRPPGGRQGARDARAGRDGGAACARDAFYPFPDAVEACLDAGVRAFAQPGGSVRDADAVAAVDAAGGTMLITGVRHFRH